MYTLTTNERIETMRRKESRLLKTNTFTSEEEFLSKQVADLCNELRKIRKHSEISVKDLCREIKVSKNTLQSIENLRTCPNISQVVRILDFLGYKLVIEKA